jgi:hypothetical protein
MEDSFRAVDSREGDEETLKLLGEIVTLFREDLYSTKKTKNLDEKIIAIVDRMDYQE